MRRCDSGLRGFELVVAVLALLVTPAEAQTWKTGDNSSIVGCSASCSVDDPADLSCWEDTRSFFEKSLLQQMRHYVAVIVDIDQWYRRNYNKSGYNFADVQANATARWVDLFKELNDAELERKAVIDLDTTLTVVKTLIDRAKNKSSILLTRAPHFQCPTPCEYTYDMTRNIFIASITLNILLVISIIPVVWRTLRNSQQHGDDKFLD